MHPRRFELPQPQGASVLRTGSAPRLRRGCTPGGRRTNRTPLSSLAAHRVQAGLGTIARHLPNWRKQQELNPQYPGVCPASNGMGLPHAQCFRGGRQRTRISIPKDRTRFQRGPRPARFTFQTWRRVRDSNSLCSFESAGLANRCDAPTSPTLHGAADWNRTSKHGGLSSAAFPICVLPPNFGGAGEIRTLMLARYGLNVVCLPIPPRPHGARRGTRTPTLIATAPQAAVSSNSTIRAKLDGERGRNRTDNDRLCRPALCRLSYSLPGTRRGIPTPIHAVLSGAALTVGVHAQMKSPSGLEGLGTSD